MKRAIRFVFPRHKRQWARLIVVACLAVFVSKYLIIPVKIVGTSMEETVKDGDWHFASRLSYLFGLRKLAYGDIALVAFHGESVFLLKRVVATAGDRVAFKDGRLFRNGKKVEESYVKGPCDWNLEERQVKEGYVYVVGDNRSFAMEGHVFGQAARGQVRGVVLW